MSWDKKARGHKDGYLYRNRRVNGRPVKEYVGRGHAAEMVALLDEHARGKRHAGRLEVSKERVCLALADLALKQSRELTNLLATAVLILEGYHVHHGCLRRRRVAHGKNGA